jgi:hypothetical protein
MKIIIFENKDFHKETMVEEAENAIKIRGGESKLVNNFLELEEELQKQKYDWVIVHGDYDRLADAIKSDYPEVKIALYSSSISTTLEGGGFFGNHFIRNCNYDYVLVNATTSIGIMMNKTKEELRELKRRVARE